jgi:phage baseplate assembly protein gpV
MADEAIKFGLRQQVQVRPSPEKVNGVSLATVSNNVDPTGEARVQLMLPWLPGFMPWARVATPMAGMLRGTFFIPQIGDEVLVAFNQGDVREPVVVGGLWNTIDRPPSLSPTDAVTQRKIRTPLGHELSFDEATQSVTLSTNTLSRVTLDPLKAELSTPLASVAIGKDGDVTITASTRISLVAPVVEIKAGSVLTAESAGMATLKAGAACAVQGVTVAIN